MWLANCSNNMIEKKLLTSTFNVFDIFCIGFQKVFYNRVIDHLKRIFADIKILNFFWISSKKLVLLGKYLDNTN